jgi:hypothetical protein
VVTSKISFLKSINQFAKLKMSMLREGNLAVESTLSQLEKPNTFNINLINFDDNIFCFSRKQCARRYIPTGM